MLLFFVFASYVTEAQIKISGTVKDKDSQEALSKASVLLSETEFSTETDNKGYFEINNVPAGSYIIVISAPDYAVISQGIQVGTESIELGTILLGIQAKDNGGEAIIELSNEELEADAAEMQTNVSGILNSSNDVFLSTAGFGFGPLRFNVRGYDNKYTSLYMNGIETNDMESGRAVWAYWGGLNDVVRSKETRKGIADLDFGFGAIGGATNIDPRASQIRQGINLTYSFSNRNYHHRTMATYSTGMMENGWAIAASGSKRYAEEGFQEGTFYDAYAYFLSVEKKLNESHSFGLVTFGSPSKRGGSSGTTQEVYDLTGTTYNPNWGWQDGEKRNARITDSHTPMAIFTHYWKIDNTSKLQSSFAFSKGKYNRTSLNWFEAEDPRPDYYRYLPSYMTDTAAFALRTEEFINGERQINWDSMYQANYTSFDTIYNADGIDGNTVSGKQSQYILENSREENIQMQFNSVYKKNISDNFKVNAGIQYRYYKSRHYKTLEDLLGGDFIVDIDKYAARDFAGEGVDDNDLNNPNHIVDKIGEIFGHDYHVTANYAELWAQANYNLNRFNFYLAGNGSYSNFWRTGNMQSGKFPDDSYGDSENLSFANYGAKFGTTYKISGMHFLHADAAYLNQAPDFRNSFISPRTRNQAVDNLESETILSAQAGYVLQSAKVKASFDVYYTEFRDRTEVRSFYFDEYNNFVNFVMNNIDQTHQGMELGIEYNPFPGFSIFGVGSVGYYRYSSRPDFSVYVDNSAEVQYLNETAYIDGFLISGTPQTAFAAGFKYFAPKYWRIGLNVNYLADRYLAFSALTRTIDAVKYADHSTDEFTSLIEQDKLPNTYTVDAFLGKSFRFDYKYYLNISLNITNLLNNKDIITGGYEQARLDLSNYDKFDPKYYYFSGLQYFLNVSFRF